MRYLDLTQVEIDKADETRELRADILLSKSCPFAQVLWRMYPEATYVLAHPDGMVVFKCGDTLFNIEPTEEMLDLMKRWDTGRIVSPGKFYY